LENGIDQDLLKNLKKFCKLFFFGLKVKVRQPLNLAALMIENRINEFTEKIQYNAKSIMTSLETRLPKDGFCLIGVLMSDLYPKDDWNFVFGMASLYKRIGVFSFARYDNNFFEK